MTTTSSGKAKVTLPADDQILITREFDAPKHLVWQNQEHRDAHINSGMEGGMQESMDLLEEVAVSLGD